MASSSSPAPGKHDVFLSFRGEDTRKKFVSHLYSGLQTKGILTFKDDRELQTGDSLSEELPKAIEESKIAVVVISQNYASSRWCLDELQMIMERHKKEKLKVIPIFYEVDPSDVRKQRGTFAEAFEKHEVTQKPEKVEKWREALAEVANLTGLDAGTCQDEATMVGNIARDISNWLFSMTPKDTSDIIGIDAHLKALDPLLNLGSGDEVRMIGIWGMGGIGKTTIAKCLYDEVKCHFQFHCFIGNVKKTYSDQGRENLQRQFLSKILGDENIKSQSFEINSNTIKARFRGLKLLAILDDVDDLDQLQAMAKDTSWFGPGSRIIITTRDKGLLISHEIELVHEVKYLEGETALRLFTHFAFGEAFSKDQVPNGFIELSIRASKLVQGLPLALKVLGLFLRGRKIGEWEAAISKLRGGPRKTVMECLKVSYEGLDEPNKNIFLTVACFFTEELVNRMSQLLDGKEWEVRDSLKMLGEKALIDISNDGRVTVHDLIQEMAKEIVNQQSPNDLGRRRFLWNAEEIYNVLEDGAGTDAIEGISLNMSKIPKCPTRNGALENMRNLKFLKIQYNYNCAKDLSQIHFALNHLPRRLRLLDWLGCPLRAFPYGFHGECLVELCVAFSKLEKLSEGTLFLGNLRRMDLTRCFRLKEIPSLSLATSLEELNLSYCDSLVEVPSSFMTLKKLTRLSMRYCDRLEFLPSVTGLESLKVLDLQGCSWLKSFPELSKSIVELYLCGTKIRKVPKSIQNLAALEILDVSYCNMLSKISSAIGNLIALRDLNLSYCENLWNIPDKVGNLTALEALKLVHCTMLSEIPSSVGNLIALKELDITQCKKLRTIPDSIRNMTALEILKLSGCKMLSEIPSSIGNLRALKCLNIDYCMELRYIPETIGNLQALQCLDMSGNNFKIIPASIKQLSVLEQLILSDCTKVLSLPELPSGLKCLYANDCCSLESISNICRRLFQKVMLSNCFKLGQYPVLLIQQMIYSMPLRKEEFKTWACFSASELPDCFNHQSTEQRMTIPCPLTDSGFKLVGFVVGVVVACGYSSHRISDMNIHCHWLMEGYQSGHIHLDPENLPSHVPNFHVGNDLLFVFSCNFLEKKFCNEISFHLDLDFETTNVVYGCKIKRCGIHLCFTEELQQAQSSLPLKSGIYRQDIEKLPEEENFSNLRRIHLSGDSENLNNDEEAQAPNSKRQKFSH